MLGLVLLVYANCHVFQIFVRRFVVAKAVWRETGEPVPRNFCKIVHSSYNGYISS